MKRGICMLTFSLAFNFSFSQTLQSVTDLDNKTSNALRVTGSSNLIGGPALELYYHEGRGSVVSHDRQTNQFKPLYIEALTTSILNGSVGIGTTSPAYKLDVNGGGRFADKLSLLTNNEGYAIPVLTINSGTGGLPNSGAAIEFYKGLEGSPMGRIFTTNTFSSGAGNSIGKLVLSSYNNAYNDELTLSSGNVGIGMSSPDAKLRVDANSGTAFKVIGSNGYLTIDNVGAGYNYYNANAAHDFQVNGVTKLLITSGGNVGIGTSEPGSYKLAVEGTIGSRKMKVTQEIWADYVFDSSYQLAPLSHVESFIKENKHLPEVPSAAEVKKDGLDLGNNQVLLLKKIEELTLYIIQQNKEIVELKKRMSEMEVK